MTPQTLTLEEFGTSLPSETSARPQAQGDTEAIRVEAFETGYRDGWEDCVAAEQQSKARIGADLGQTLANLSFTYLEARTDVLTGLQVLLDGIVDRLLPAIAAASVGPMVRAELTAILDRVPDGKCDLIAAPAACPGLETLLSDEIAIDVSVVPEPAYSEGHVTLRFGAELREIDLDTATEQIAGAIRDFASDAEQTTRIPDQRQAS
ncbi:hypothetical protein E2K80_17015 [Rhodophyticola sp. CCM32]|uniref:hypothetical protein n=1 Tax=Rhodophyticola sp. CCM32 TaxID=2916397 RepID=UPI00107F66E0|nr:hypothetical protein [Rhodophyticola sp. CCM32]QBY02229.1 hypothetical protein E2K80_17015 [Rhodophyticola sp. CCM32]